jgi:hypothetical protein
MKLGDFAETISTRIWESVGRANWRKFKDARAFVRGLGLSLEHNGSTIFSRAKSPPTFRLIRIWFMRMTAGLDMAVGSGLVRLPLTYANFEHS